MTRAYVGLGANLGDAAGHVERAIAQLAALGAVRASSLYRSEPLGDPDQPWYVNAVVALDTELEAHELLLRLRAIERRFGRAPGRPRWAPRELDLDLLLYGEQISAEADLVLPHPGLTLRRFVLEPLAELAPDARDPRSGRSAAELLAGLDDPLTVEKLPARSVR